MVMGFSSRTGEYPLDWDTCVDNRSVPTVLFCGALEKGGVHIRLRNTIAQFASVLSHFIKFVSHVTVDRLTCYCRTGEAGRPVGCP